MDALNVLAKFQVHSETLSRDNSDWSFELAQDRKTSAKQIRCKCVILFPGVDQSQLFGNTFLSSQWSKYQINRWNLEFR